MKQITEIADPRLVKGLAHPLRIQILHLLQGRTASPSEISEEIDAPLGNVSYHVRFLARVGLIELHRTEPRRGAVEHYYRAAGRIAVSEQVWSQMPEQVRDAVLVSTLDQVGRSVGSAAAAGGFDHQQAHATRIAMTLDTAGFAALSAAVAELQQRAVAIEVESASRIAERAGVACEPVEPAVRGPVRAELVTMLFESSPGVAGEESVTPVPRDAAPSTIVQDVAVLPAEG